MNGRNIEHDLSEFFRRTKTPEPSLRLRAAVAAARVESSRSRMTTFRRPRTAFSLLGLAASIVLAAGVLMVVTSRPDRNGPANPGSVASAISTLMTQLPSAPIPTASPTPEPGFSLTGSMSTGRGQDTATLLFDGRVLIAGGNGRPGFGPAFDSAELYDPATGKFSPTGSMTTTRADQTATLLSDGRVLMAGGFAGPELSVNENPQQMLLSSAEIYDPVTGTFTETGSMTITREGATATLLSDGRVLLAGGTGVTTNLGVKSLTILASAEIYDPATGKFSPTGSMGAARKLHTATRLSDGRVLIVGGSDNSKLLASAELYDPATGIFSPTGSMTITRESQTATLLSEGRVLIAGGFDGSKQLASAELYDPTAGKFSPTGSMATTRAGHTAKLLSDGRVLIAGGFDGSKQLASAELYDPTAGKFSPTGSMATARAGHTATLLSDGRMLVTGGIGTDDLTALASAELYDPKTGKFSPTGSMATARAGHTATLLSDGRMLVTGGIGTDDLTALASAELYDPKTGTFSSTGSMHDYRWGATATLLPDGRVLIAGGASGSDIFGSPSLALASAELYDPATGVFKLTGWMTTPRELHTATLLPDGRVLLVGGFGATIFPTSAELYDPKTGKFSPTGSMAAARYQHTATLLADGRVLIAGGLGREGINSTPLASAELYDPTTSTFGSAGSMTTTRVGHTATRLSDGQVLIVGGGSTSAELYDPKTGKFSPTGSMATLRLGHTATLLSGGRVLIVGGVEDTSATPTSTDLVPEMYDPSTAKFSPAGSMTMYRSAHTATLLSDGRILVAGGNDASNNPQASAELYQP